MNDARLGEAQLSRLLDVGRALVSELEVESVLGQVLEVARELTGARYAAIGILDEEKQELERFLYVGIEEATRRAIGPLPRGRGLLGELIRNPKPLRLANVSEHPRSYGFPSEHPPMTSFLGVPILIRGEAYGNLYLADTAHGEFDDADEQTVIVLADWAAIAIDNARLYGHVESRKNELEQAVRGLEATTAIARAVGAETNTDRVLELIVKRGRALIDARALAILLPADGQLYVAASAGEAEPVSPSLRVPLEGTVLGEVLRSGEAESLADLSTRMRLGLEEIKGSASAALVVPLLFRGRAQGMLLAFDSLGRTGPAFDSDSEHLLTSFAAAAANALATAQSVETERLRHSIEASEQERKRWARELHDETLQELGALRVILTSALLAKDGERLAGSVQQAVDQLGTTIGGLQGLITELRPAALDELGTKPAIEALVRRTHELSGLDIDLHVDPAFEGGSEATRHDSALESAIYRLAQEGLNNVVKHAEARRVSVEVLENGPTVLVIVRDDGKGFRVDDSHSGFGLVGMRERAELVGGSVQIESAPGEGTSVTATLPARRSGAAHARAG